MTPSPNTTTLLDARDVVVIRLNGIPRDPTDGRHRRVLVFTAPTLGLRLLAMRLRSAADQLDDLAEQS